MALHYSVLHWLLMPQQIQFNIAFLAFNCIRGAHPAYFQHFCIPTANLSGRAALCSAEHGDLAMARTETELCKRSLSVAAPVIWNILPENLHSSPSPKESSGMD